MAACRWPDIVRWDGSAPNKAGFLPRERARCLLRAHRSPPRENSNGPVHPSRRACVKLRRIFQGRSYMRISENLLFPLPDSLAPETSELTPHIRRTRIRAPYPRNRPERDGLEHEETRGAGPRGHRVHVPTDGPERWSTKRQREPDRSGAPVQRLEQPEVANGARGGTTKHGAGLRLGTRAVACGVRASPHGGAHPPLKARRWASRRAYLTPPFEPKWSLASLNATIPFLAAELRDVTNAAATLELKEPLIRQAAGGDGVAGEGQVSRDDAFPCRGGDS